MPAVDIKEKEERFIVIAELPGIESNDVEAYIDENHRLVIKGEQKSEQKNEKEGYLRIERKSGSFYRAFKLPDNVEAEAISAKVKHGLMEVEIPKKAKVTGRKIPVE